MGFSLATCSLDLHNNFPHSHLQKNNGVFKMLSFNEVSQRPINFHLPKPHKNITIKTLKASPSSKIQESATEEAVQFDERTSSTEVKKEIEMCYDLIRRLGRGVVYLGSARMGPGHEHYIQTQELAREARLVANLLGCTSWSGAGPGLMDAATQGALQAGKPVGGFKIGKEANEWTSTNYHPYLPSHTYLTCRFFSARKHGLVDAAVRTSKHDRTAVIVLPGGIGTLDEAFEILALIQLERIGSALPVPFLLMNYDSFYSKLLDFLDVCEDWGTVSKGEVSSLWRVCNSNSEALAYLEEFYDIHPFVTCSVNHIHGDGPTIWPVNPEIISLLLGEKSKDNDKAIVVSSSLFEFTEKYYENEVATPLNRRVWLNLLALLDRLICRGGKNLDDALVAAVIHNLKVVQIVMDIGHNNASLRFLVLKQVVFKHLGQSVEIFLQCSHKSPRLHQQSH
ncbi:probable cytokinin riboside 5'-monophosphate phosphoribohydrolase LOGL10 [Tanacetum coccineum]